MSGRSTTIFALSSGSLPCAIAIVRISGPDAFSVAPLLGFKIPPPRRAMLRTLYDSSGTVLDHAMVVGFPGPASPTGEDVVELHLHGSRAVVRAVLKCLGESLLLRPAEPGEFTRRALANGRIDVFQAEALGDLLLAETEIQRRRAISAPAVLAEAGAALRRQVLDLSAQVEAAIDHGEELDQAGLAAIRSRVADVVRELEAELARPSSELLRDGFRVVIAGPPNAGKSTLLNRLAGREVAITAPVEGTTRDIIEVGRSLHGIPVRLFDTAGLRIAADPVEAIGIGRAEKAVGEADVLVWLGSGPPPATEAAVVKILPRADLLPVEPESDVLRVSAISGEGVAVLEERIAGVLEPGLPPENKAMWNDRQRELLLRAAEALARGAYVDDPVFLAEELRAARTFVDLLCGHAGFENLLDSIFGRFCLGK